LAHKALDHTVEAAALEVQRLASLPNPFLASTQRSKVLGGPWHNVAVKLKGDTAGFVLIDGLLASQCGARAVNCMFAHNVKEDARSRDARRCGGSGHDV
jgi:hypothetical protein